jgi:pilus assembly protein CpaB
VGRSAAGHLSPGTPVTSSGLVQPREEPLNEGQLLMPVTVTDEAAARTLQPGHRVRIYTAGNSADTGSTETAGGSEDADRSGGGSAVPGAAADSGSSPALVDMAVVSSVARESGSSLSAAVTVVTLIVTEEQAAALAAVAGSGLHFALLN